MKPKDWTGDTEGAPDAAFNLYIVNYDYTVHNKLKLKCLTVNSIIVCSCY